MRKGIVISCIIICLTFVFAQSPRKTSHKPLPKLRGDEKMQMTGSVPYLGGRQSPGDIIGMTWYDTQASGSYGQRIIVDDLGQPHIDWMKRDAAGVNRYCAWNARFSNGSWYGETQASPSWSGYVRIAVTRDSDPNNQRSVITYHFNPGAGYYSWVDIDGGNLWGAWPNTPRAILINGYMWPCICVANNNNFLMATGDYNANAHHLFVSTNEGITWTLIADFDSVATLSYFLRSSRNSGSNKVVFAHTRYITDTIASGQLDSDIWYMVSTDGGITWGPHTNLTNYQPYPIDSVRAYCDVNAVFDYNDNLHISWTGMKIDDTTFYRVSKIFHWDEVNDTITVINRPSIYYNEPGGWWIEGTLGQSSAWRLPADQPQCIVGNYGDLICLWHGNDDTTDVSAGGYFNGELYGAVSDDNGISWSNYANLTNTRSPGAPAGACNSEVYMTAHAYAYNDSVWLTYIEDKDAGDAGHVQGVETENPVRAWFFTPYVSKINEEDKKKQISSNDFSSTIFSGPLLLPKGKKCRIYDITGRVVMPDKIKPGIYFIEVDGKITQKVVKVR